MTSPALAVVVPAYRQAAFLAEAVLSAEGQTVADQVGVVVVNDGCPDPATDALGRALADRSGGRTVYLRTDNRGLAAARNEGVRFALAAWPTVEAVFPLDADNRLEPGALAALWGTLRRAPAAAGWTYTDLHCFGETEAWVAMPRRFSPRRLLEANYCDAGSLVRATIFRAGCWYDESMRGGYEDWEFFIHATALGFAGVHTPDAGFRYRRRPGSMVTGAVAHHAAIVAHIRAKHAALYAAVAAGDPPGPGSP